MDTKEIANLPIGIFDSGLGGLTIVRAVRNLLPFEHLIYYGDTAHLPYGDKSPELIQEYSRDIAIFLKNRPVKAIVIACNTASAVALEVVKAVAGSIPVFDVVSPASLYALSIYQRKIGIIGTKATIRSGIYKQLLLQYAEKEIGVVEKATPLLVPMIEEGWVHNRVSQDVIDAYLSDTGFEDIDTLILGCTHYPLIKAQIEQYFQKNRSHPVHVVDSSIAVAEHIRKALDASGLLHSVKLGESPVSRFFLSDFSQSFHDSARLFLREDIQFEKP
jgi:glutamate racemase